jgi:hypothetical protein
MVCLSAQPAARARPAPIFFFFYIFLSSFFKKVWSGKQFAKLYI